MFGNLAAFVNGNMFCGLFGDGLFVRLPEDERAALLLEPGAGMLEPMAGRPLREYVVLPRAWQAQPELLREWLRRGLTWTASLPVRAPKRGRMAR
jgi:TfoX/Sxy family transcriptional regulator of competence genes